MTGWAPPFRNDRGASVVVGGEAVTSLLLFFPGRWLLRDLFSRGRRPLRSHAFSVGGQSGGSDSMLRMRNVLISCVPI